MKPLPSEDLSPYLTAAQTLGATAVEVFGFASYTTTVEFAGNRLHQIAHGWRQGRTVRGWWGGRVGLATACGPMEPAVLAERAQAWAAVGTPQEPCLAALSPNPPQVQQGQTVPWEALVAGGEAAIALCREALAEVVCSGTWEAIASHWQLLNSAGLHCGQTRQWVEASLVAERVQGDDWLVVSESTEAEGAIAPAVLTAPVIQRWQWSQTLAEMPTGILPVVFSPNAVAWGLTPILTALSARAARLGTSPWGDRRGETVAPPTFTLAQDPGQPYGVPFDEEGTLTQPFAWIANGVLQGFYGDRRNALALGEPLRGNGFRSSGIPEPELFQVCIGAGPHTERSLKSGAALWVEAVLGEDPEPGGDFSVSLEQAFRLENGEIVGRVKDGILAGNLLHALPRLALGCDRQWVGSVYTPPWRLEGLSLSG